jgi:putative endopeptidase
MGKGTEGGAPARAQDDLYAHVNREWLDANPVPAAYGRWGTFEMLNDAALENTKICLEEAGDGDKGGAFLASGMRAAEQDSRAALAPTLKLAREFAAAGKTPEPRSRRR